MIQRYTVAIIVLLLFVRNAIFNTIIEHTLAAKDNFTGTSCDNKMAARVPGGVRM
jgi:hypothetical protein